MKSRPVFAALIAFLIAGWSVPAWAAFIDFEQGAGQDQEAIGNSIPGLNFTTTTGGDWFFGFIGPDSQAGVYNYPWKSDNGKQDEYWDYFMSGDVAAYVMDIEDIGVVSLTSETAKSFTVGYSIARGFDFTLEAYDSAGHLLGNPVVGGPNCREEPQGQGGLAYLTVTAPEISYVKLFGDPASGGYWIVDNISYVPSGQDVPEWPPLGVVVPALATFIVCRRRR